MTNDILISLLEVKRLTSLSGPTIWRLRKENKFPQNCRISAGRVAWSQKAIQGWIAEKMGEAA